MLPDKYEKQARDDCKIDNDNSPLVPHFKWNTHVRMFATCQLTCKKRLSSSDRIQNTFVIKNERYLEQMKISCRSHRLTSVTPFAQVDDRLTLWLLKSPMLIFSSELRPTFLLTKSKSFGRFASAGNKYLLLKKSTESQISTTHNFAHILLPLNFCFDTEENI